MFFYLFLGNFSKGEALLNQAMTIASPLGDRILWSQLLNQKSHLCFLQRDYSQAVASSEEALLLQRQLKSDALIIHTLLRLTNALTQLDEFARAEQLLDEFEQLAIAQHDSRHISLALACRCRLLTRQRRFAELAECSLQAIQTPFIRDHMPFKLSISLSAVAVALYYGDVADCVRLGIAIPHCLDHLHSPLSGPEIQSLPFYLAEARKILSPADYEQAVGDGERMSNEQALGLARKVMLAIPPQKLQNTSAA